MNGSLADFQKSMCLQKLMDTKGKCKNTGGGERRFGFDKSRHKCREFEFCCCESANDNNFQTKELCELLCENPNIRVDNND